MKSFLIKIMIFIFPILVLIFTFEFFLQKIPNEYKYKSNYLNNQSHNIEVLILGSSHSFYGINPEYFDLNTFNASHNGQTLDYDYKIFNKYRTKLTNLKFLILPISYFTLYSRIEHSGVEWRIKYYDKYYHFNKRQTLLSKLEITKWNLHSNINKIISYYNSDIKDCCSILGWGSAIKTLDSPDLKMTGKQAAMSHTCDDINSSTNLNIYYEHIEYLDSILSWCQNNHVNTLLITPPAYQSYISNLSSEQLGTTIKTCKTLSTKYAKCQYLNLLYDPSFFECDFYDADHLSKDGATKLSNIISKYIKQLKF